MTRSTSNAPHRTSTPTLLVVTLVAALLGASDAAAATPVRRNTISVPSKEYPTIQSGIDAVSDGGRVLIGPGRYEESLVVIGKRVTLQGSGVAGDERTVLIGSDSDRATIGYGLAGGGRVSSLVIQGGAYGLAGEARFPAPVDLREVRIIGSGRGIYGTFSELTVKGVVINETVWNGMSLTGVAGRLLISASRILHSGHVGLYILNLQPSLEWIRVDDATILGHPGGGIVVEGGGRDVKITDSVIAGNGFAGLRFMFTHFAYIGDSVISNTHNRPDGTWGDGVVAMCSQVALEGSQPVIDPPQFPVAGSNLIELSDRVGLTAFGSLVSVGNTLFSNNPINIHRARWPCGTSSDPETETTLVDLGGNLCGTLASDGFHVATCHAAGELEVPNPIPPETP